MLRSYVKEIWRGTGVVETALIHFCTPLCLLPSVGKRMSGLFLHRDESCHFMMENTKQILLARALFMPAVFLLLRARCAGF